MNKSAQQISFQFDPVSEMIPDKYGDISSFANAFEEYCKNNKTNFRHQMSMDFYKKFFDSIGAKADYPTVVNFMGQKNEYVKVIDDIYSKYYKAYNDRDYMANQFAITVFGGAKNLYSFLYKTLKDNMNGNNIRDVAAKKFKIYMANWKKEHNVDSKSLYYKNAYKTYKNNFLYEERRSLYEVLRNALFEKFNSDPEDFDMIYNKLLNMVHLVVDDYIDVQDQSEAIGMPWLSSLDSSPFTALNFKLNDFKGLYNSIFDRLKQILGLNKNQEKLSLIKNRLDGINLVFRPKAMSLSGEQGITFGEYSSELNVAIIYIPIMFVAKILKSKGKIGIEDISKMIYNTEIAGTIVHEVAHSVQPSDKYDKSYEYSKRPYEELARLESVNYNKNILNLTKDEDADRHANTLFKVFLERAGVDITNLDNDKGRKEAIAKIIKYVSKVNNDDYDLRMRSVLNLNDMEFFKVNYIKEALEYLYAELAKVDQGTVGYKDKLVQIKEEALKIADSHLHNVNDYFKAIKSKLRMGRMNDSEFWDDKKLQKNPTSFEKYRDIYMSTVAKLVKIADELDKNRMVHEANIVDSILKTII